MLELLGSLASVVKACVLARELPGLTRVELPMSIFAVTASEWPMVPHKGDAVNPSSSPAAIGKNAVWQWIITSMP
jgi:hypothetical protein